MKILDFLLFWGAIFALLDPDPDPQFECGSGYGSGSETLYYWCRFRSTDGTWPSTSTSLWCIALLRQRKSEFLLLQVSEYGRHLAQYFNLFVMYCTLGTTEKTQLLRLNLPAIFIQVFTRTFSYFSKNITIRGSSSTYRYIFISYPVSNERLLGGWVWFEVGEFISKILTQSYSVCILFIRYYTLFNCTVFLNFNAASQRQKKFNRGLRVLFQLVSQRSAWLRFEPGIWYLAAGGWQAR